MTDYHRDGNCNPDHCSECDWLMANMIEDHSRNVCGGYSTCTICTDAHDCDVKSEPKCQTCQRVTA